LEPVGLEADESRSLFMSNDDNTSYGEPVASSTGTHVICLNCC